MSAPHENLIYNSGSAAENNKINEQYSTQSNGTVKINYATFWERFAAAGVDTNIVVLITIICGFFLEMVFPVLGLSVTSKKVDAFMKLLDLGIGIFYYSSMESGSNMATFGKQWMGLKVTNFKYSSISLGQAIGRYFARWISLLLLYIGYLIQPFNTKRQTLHDMMAGTIVIRVQQSKSGFQIFIISILSFLLLSFLMIIIFAMNKANY
jgi:uncharacterized RDD family membrane protein YckC